MPCLAQGPANVSLCNRAKTHIASMVVAFDPRDWSHLNNLKDVLGTTTGGVAPGGAGSGLAAFCASLTFPLCRGNTVVPRARYCADMRGHRGAPPL